MMPSVSLKQFSASLLVAHTSLSQPVSTMGDACEIDAMDDINQKKFNSVHFLHANQNNSMTLLRI
jgi:hypothetical protein